MIAEHADSSTAAWHSARFAEFCQRELAAGGPDPHMRYIGAMSDGMAWEEKVWRIGLYVAFYNVPTAEVVWQNWSWQEVITDMHSKTPRFPTWIAEEWHRFQVRRERRAARTPVKMNKSLEEYIFWTSEELPTLIRDLPDEAQVAYELLWDEANSEISYFGRYALTKLLEAYRRFLPVPIVTPDIRPNGGWSPRTTLNLLNAEDINPLDNRAAALTAANWSAHRSKMALQSALGAEIDFFRYEVMLCEYHESYEGKRQYPGRSNDSELSYLAKVKALWPGYQSTMLAARVDCCPEEALGEHAGWDGVREDLGPLLHDTGLVWSDLLYLYPSREPRADFARQQARLVLMAQQRLAEDPR